MWPTVAEFARDVGQNVAAVKKWKQRDSIPSVHWLAVVQAAQSRGIEISLNDLAAIQQQQAA